MSHFVYNVVIAIWVFAGWFLAGLGFTLVLLPRRQREVFILAPLIGLCLLVLIGVFQIAILLTPLMPRINVAALIFISLMLCLWAKRESFWRGRVVNSRSNDLRLWLLPLSLILVFAWLFHHDGFHLLVGSSDQLQYSLDARQMLEEMHTGSTADLPVPRHDHIIYDITTRLLPYDRSYRRGAEVILATISAVTGLSFEEAFPVEVLCALITLGLTVGFIGRFILRFSSMACIILQLLFLSSFYLLLMHVQGSLALILGLAPGLAALAFLSRMVHSVLWGELLMAAMLVASYFSIYCEPVLVNIVFPSFLLVLWRLHQSWKKGFAVIGRLGLVYLVALILAPTIAYSVVVNAIDNLGAVLVYLHSLGMAVSHPAVVSPLAWGPLLQLWTLASVVLGFASYYDTSAFNAHFSSFVAAAPWMSCSVFFIFWGGGLWGLLKTKNVMARLLMVPLFLWGISSLMMMCQQDGLRFARSLHYAMPFIFLGLAALVNQRHNTVAVKWSRLGAGTTAVSWLLILGLMGFNFYTDVRTMKYLAAHDVSTDTIVLRFDRRDGEWKLLQQELAISALHNTPVLFSGFAETVRPLAIASLMSSQPHVLGSSILNFWPLYSFTHNFRWARLNTRLSEQDFTAAQQQENRYWVPHMEREMEQRSEQAVVPVGHGFPVEWLSFGDIYPPKVKRFPNICDVVYRKEKAVILEDNMVSPLKKDVIGLFRQLQSSGPIVVHDLRSTTQLLVVGYEGKIGDIRLQIRDRLYEGKKAGSKAEVKIVVLVRPEDTQELKLIVRHAVKLRTMTWG